MGCKSKANAKPTVTLAILAERRNICRECDQATRCADPRFAEAKGLVSASVCRAEKARHPDRPCKIVVGTGMARAACAMGKWHAVTAVESHTQNFAHPEAARLDHQPSS